MPGLGGALAAVVALLSTGTVTVALIVLTVAVVVLGFGIPPVVDWLHGWHMSRMSRVEAEARRSQLLADEAAALVRDHFGPRGRGTLPSSVRTGTYFSGRSQVLSELMSWMGGASAVDARARVVTGAPGSGKSAVLGRLMSLAGVREGRTEGGSAIGGQSEGNIGGAVLARGRTVDEVAAALARSLDIDEAGAGGFLAALRESWQPRPAVLVVDAVDEAADPQRLIIELLEPLAAASVRTRIRLLAATRRGASDGLLRLFGASAVIVDLDSPGYFEPGDVEEYVFRTLMAAEDPQVATPYRGHPDVAAAVAPAVAARAGSSFLVAQLSALALAAAARPLDVAVGQWADGLPATVAAAMERYLREVQPGGRWLRDLLMALAWAQGDGLDDPAAWAAIATAVGTGDYSEHDVARLLLSSSAVDLLHLTPRGGRTAFRLFHEALAEYLRGETGLYLNPTEVQRRITEVLVAQVPRATDGAPDWSRTDGYTRTFLQLHAAKGGALDPLLADAGFLTVAEPDRLLAALPAAVTERGRCIAQVIQRVGQQLLMAPREEQACYLEMAARMAGETSLAEALVGAAPGLPWSVPWASWQPLAPSQLLGHHDNWVVALSAVDTPAGTVAISASPSTLRAWTLPEGTPIATGLGEASSPIIDVAAFADAGSPAVLTLHENGDIVRSTPGSSAPSQVIAQNRAGGLWLVSHAGQPAIITVTSEGTTEALSAADGHPLALPAVSLGGGWILAAASVGQQILAAVRAPDEVSVSVWDLEAGTLLGPSAQLADQFPGKDPAHVWAAAFTERDGSPVLLCACSGGGPVFTWDPLQGKRLGEPSYGVAAFSALITTDSDRELQWWGDSMGNLNFRCGDDGAARLIAAHDNGIGELAACRPGGRLAVITGSRDGAVRVWHPDALPSGTPPRPRITSFHVLPPAGDSGHPLLAVLTKDGTATVLDATDGRPVVRLTPPGPDGQLSDLAPIPGPGPAILTVDSERHVAAWRPPSEHLEPLWRLPEDSMFWNIAITDGNPPTLLVAQSNGHVAFFDAETGRSAREPLDTGVGDDEYRVLAGPTPASGGIRLFTFGYREPAASEWIISPGQELTSRTLFDPPDPDVGYKAHRGAPAALAAATLDDIPVIVGVGGYSGIYVWDARNGALLHSAWLKQTQHMVFYDVDIADIAGRPTALCGGHARSLAICPLGTSDEHHLWVGSVITHVRSLPGKQVVVAGPRGILLAQLGSRLPGQRTPGQ